MDLKGRAWPEELHVLEQGRIPHVLVTVIAIRGSYPQQIGSKMVVVEQGLRAGTIGGGKIEAWAIEQAQKYLGNYLTPSISSHVINLLTELSMSCGGEVTLLFERLPSIQKPLVAVFGAGHVGQKLAPLLCDLHFPVQIMDSRPEWLHQLPEKPLLRKIHVATEKMPELISTLPSGAMIASVSMGHWLDFPIVREALQRDCFLFVGSIGSRSKATKLRRDLLESGISAHSIERLVCPLGLDLGGQDPMEVALSIAAQLQQVSFTHKSRPVNELKSEYKLFL